MIERDALICIEYPREIGGVSEPGRLVKLIDSIDVGEAIWQFLFQEKIPSSGKCQCFKVGDESYASA